MPVMQAKEYYTLVEAAEALKMSHQTLRNYMAVLDIEGRKFPRNRKVYLSHAQVEQIRAYRVTPWKIEE